MASYEPPAEYPGYPGQPPYGQPGEPPYGQSPYGQPPYGQGYGQPGPPVGPWHPGTQLGLPDGVVIASQGRRVGAYFLAIPLVFLTCGIGYLVWGAIVWGKGTSPALQVLGMRAWKPERRGPAGWGDMAMRNGLDWLISMVTCGISSIVSFVMFLSDEPLHRTLGDRVGGTVIVFDPQRRLG
ncbi:MAG TPA: RDD family protein [Nocardioides sp.]|nr:RDD family protein [Nocardioides sp.]